MNQIESNRMNHQSFQLFAFLLTKNSCCCCSTMAVATGGGGGGGGGFDQPQQQQQQQQQQQPPPQQQQQQQPRRHLDDLTSRLTELAGITPSPEWLDACLAHLSATGVISNSDVNAIDASSAGDAVLHQILHADLRDVVRRIDAGSPTNDDGVNGSESRSPGRVLRDAIQASLHPAGGNNNNHDLDPSQPPPRRPSPRGPDPDTVSPLTIPSSSSSPNGANGNSSPPTHKATLPTTFQILLQAEECLDVSRNAETRHGTNATSNAGGSNNNPSKRLLKIVGTDGYHANGSALAPTHGQPNNTEDGHHSIVLMETSPLPALSASSLPGIKLLLHSSPAHPFTVRHGIIQIHPSNCTVLGGHVPHLIEVQRKAREMARKRSGVGVDATVRALIGPEGLEGNGMGGEEGEEEEDVADGESGDVVAPPPPPRQRRQEQQELQQQELQQQQGQNQYQGQHEQQQQGRSEQQDQYQGQQQNQYQYQQQQQQNQHQQQQNQHHQQQQRNRYQQPQRQQPQNQYQQQQQRPQQQPQAMDWTPSPAITVNRSHQQQQQQQPPNTTFSNPYASAGMGGSGPGSRNAGCSGPTNPYSQGGTGGGGAGGGSSSSSIANARNGSAAAVGNNPYQSSTTIAASTAQGQSTITAWAASAAAGTTAQGNPERRPNSSGSSVVDLISPDNGAGKSLPLSASIGGNDNDGPVPFITSGSNRLPATASTNDNTPPPPPPAGTIQTGPPGTQDSASTAPSSAPPSSFGKATPASTGTRSSAASVAASSASTPALPQSSAYTEPLSFAELRSLLNRIKSDRRQYEQYEGKVFVIPCKLVKTLFDFRFDKIKSGKKKGDKKSKEYEFATTTHFVGTAADGEEKVSAKILSRLLEPFYSVRPTALRKMHKEDKARANGIASEGSTQVIGEFGSLAQFHMKLLLSAKDYFAQDKLLSTLDGPVPLVVVIGKE